ncbi:Uncharacterised protein [Bartonella vinsonii]|nr:Uncharacterised protein [Bartonella vinsonii]VEJ46170.1 Uncharacterised protein [Bartonella vinsonii]
MKGAIKIIIVISFKDFGGFGGFGGACLIFLLIFFNKK